MPSKSVEEVCGWHILGHRCYKEARFPGAHQQGRPTHPLTKEDAGTDGSIPFLDTIVMPQPDGSLLTSLYRKPTHADQYLQWNNHHHLSAKFSVINTLKHRAKTVCSNQHLLRKEADHLNKALKRCKYPEWALSRANIKQKRRPTLIKGQSITPTKLAVTTSPI